jgi:IS30 family transposase
MALKPEHLKDAKAALKSMSAQREKKLTRADFVTGLIKDIHAKMTAGFSLEEICAELNKTLPDGEQFKVNTFKTYVRRARTQARITPTRSWTRRTGPAETRIQAVPDKGTTKGQKEDPASDFRDQGGDL